MSNGEVFQFVDSADLVGTEEVSTTQTIPRCLALVEVVKNSLGASKARPEEGKRAKLMASVEMKVHQPTIHAGVMLHDQFVLASEDFPDRFDKTAFGARRWKTLLGKAQVQVGTSLQHAAMTSVGHMLIVKVDIEKNEYEGRKNWRNRLVGFFALGEREVQVIDSELPPIEDEGKAGGSGGMGGMMSAAPFNPPVQTSQAPKQQQFMPPVQAPALSPSPPLPPSPQAPSNPQLAGLTVACMVCNPARQVSVNDYSGHMGWHAANPGKAFPG